MSKGSRIRGGSDKFRKNFKLKGAYEPQWKKDLRKLKQEKKITTQDEEQ